MEMNYIAPELILIGQADAVVFGGSGLGPDGADTFLGAMDFEFEQD